MKYKKALCVTLSLFLLSGCQGESTIENSTENTIENITLNEPPLYTLKWCLTEHSISDKAVEAINQTLREDGCQYEIEVYQIPLSKTTSYADQFPEYEELYGPFDILSSGFEYVKNSGASYDFIKSGHFIELEDMSEFSAVPEKLWEAVKVDGKIYTVPCLTLNHTGITFYFNKAYISQEQIDDFDGDLSKLADMVEGLSETEDFLPIDFNILFSGYCKSFPYTEKGGLLLDNSSFKAYNPYEYEPFVEYIKNVNRLYNNGLLWSKLDLSPYNYEAKEVPKEFAVHVSPIAYDEDTLKEEYGNMELEVYSLPYYLENLVIDTYGVAANSEHKELALDFLKRLYSGTKYADAILSAAPNASLISLGISPKDITGNYETVIVSTLADFELMKKDINDEIQEIIITSYDGLCKAEDFDKALEEINAQLKAAGIDDYIDHVNKILEERF